MATTKITPGMTITEINKILKSKRDVTFTKGVYQLEKPMVVHSNSKITCESCVTFVRRHGGRMLQLYVDSNTTKYNGTHDVTWIGGTFMANTHTHPANVIVVFHCKNITLQNIAIIGCVGNHSIEINASSNVLVDHCLIQGQSAKNGETFREALQIDFANYDGLKIKNATVKSPCYDGTHCKHLTIDRCSFVDCPNGIGTHTVGEAEVWHEDIKIEYCRFIDIKKAPIKVLGMKDVQINGCGNNAVIVNSITAAHELSGGKVKLAKPRNNINVTVDNVKVI